MQVLSYGAAIRRLALPDPSGTLVDLVLGHETTEGWEHANESYFGVVPGRISGRLPGGHLVLGEQHFQLACNDRGNHLHGGNHGFDKQIWQGEALDQDDGTVGLRMHFQSPDGEEGYPGTVNLSATYRLTPDNALLFETEARADQLTPVSLAQHSYFNLAGAGECSAEGHVVQIFADHVMTTDSMMTPLGIVASVEGMAADLREPRTLREILPQLWQQHGDLYRLQGAKGLKPAARLLDPQSGRVMDVSTTHDYLQFYTAAHLDGSLVGKGGKAYPKYGGLCFECQGYPDPAAGFGDILVTPGQVQRHQTIYAFSQTKEKS